MLFQRKMKVFVFFQRQLSWVLKNTYSLAWIVVDTQNVPNTQFDHIASILFLTSLPLSQSHPKENGTRSCYQTSFLQFTRASVSWEGRTMLIVVFMNSIMSRQLTTSREEAKMTTRFLAWVTGQIVVPFIQMGRIETGESTSLGWGEEVEGLIKNSSFDMLIWSCLVDVQAEMSSRQDL